MLSEYWESFTEDFSAITDVGVELGGCDAVCVDVLVCAGSLRSAMSSSNSCQSSRAFNSCPVVVVAIVV